MHSAADRSVETKKEPEMKEGKGTPSSMMDTNVLYCLDCGKCTGTCPVTVVKPGFSPRRIVEMSLMDNGDDMTRKNMIWDCLTCGKCKNYCPEDVDFPLFIRTERAVARHNGNTSVLNHGGITHALAETMANTDLHQSRLEWAEGSEVAEKGDVVLFTGCMVHFDIIFEPIGLEGCRNILLNSVKILNRAGIVPAVMSGEVCCGHDQLWSGDETTFRKLMERNIEALRATGAHTIIAVCPECMSVLNGPYKDMGELDMNVIHVSQFIDELIRDGKIKVRTSGEKVTFQDPCRLVHQMKVTEEPRAAIQAVNPSGFVEMRDAKEQASCCGTTLFRNCDSYSEGMRLERLRQAQEVGAELLLTACPKCQIHFKCTLAGKCGEKDIDPKMKVMDLVTYVAGHLE